MISKKDTTESLKKFGNNCKIVNVKESMNEWANEWMTVRGNKRPPGSWQDHFGIIN